MLNSVIEFGLNEPGKHLINDIERVCHDKANVKNKFIIHLYRISHSGSLFSGRDWSQKSKRRMSIDDIKNVVSIPTAFGQQSCDIRPVFLSHSATDIAISGQLTGTSKNHPVQCS